MKKLTIFLCLFFAVLALNAKAIHDDHRRADEKARVSYAFGMAVGSNFNLGSMGIDFDYNAFADGLKAMVENEPTLFSEQEAMEIIETALQNAMEKRSVQNRTMEEEFLAMNSQRPAVQVTASGLQYEIIKDAKGEKPDAKSVVRVNYVGTFIDGSPFDSSTEEDGAFIPLDLVIRGWTEGLMLMSPGSHYRLYIPSNLAYGSDGIQGIIPPYSTLIFTVELLEIVQDDPDDEEEA
ncbi:MAG: FKBP-type peptidyl-prolyl cis-trans isomerase [Treponema sp.]|nr:FKBP-type peptidyl-prolyl cis-trans isomerase [Treponema sp.]